MRGWSKMRSMTEYLGEDALTITAVPNRVVFLFPAGSRSSFKVAVREASSRWAGVTEPILPVRRGGKVDPAWVQIAGYARPHRAVNVGCDAHDAQLASSSLGLGQVIDFHEIDRLGESRGVHIGAIRSPIQDPVAAREGADLWEIVAAGDSTDPSDGSTEWQPRRWGTDDFAGMAAIRRRSVLDYGCSGLGETWASGGSAGPTVLWITTPNSLSDATWFWNLRAIRTHSMFEAPMILLPSHALENWINLERELGALLERPYSGKPAVALQSLSVKAERLDEIAGRLGLRKHTGKNTFPIFASSRQARSDQSYSTRMDPRDWLFSQHQSGYSERVHVHRFRNSTRVKVAPPQLLDALLHQYAQNVSVLIEGGFLGRLPRRAAVAKLVHTHAAWDRDFLRLRADVHQGSELQFASPDRREVLAALLSDPGFVLTRSDKGRLADALEESRDCALAVDVRALDAITNLATPRSKELMRALRDAEPGTSEELLVALASTWGGRVDRRYRPSNGIGVTSTKGTEILERLVAGGWAERGAEVDCATCGMKSFVSLGALSTDSRCPGCGSVARLSGSTSVSVVYRLNSLVDRCSDQGAIPHVAAARALTSGIPDSCFLLGADVVWRDGRKAEVDLFGYCEKEVVAGEVKVSARSFTRAQMVRDMDLSKALGADRHVMAAMDDIPESLIADAAKLASARSLLLSVVCRGPENQLVARAIQLPEPVPSAARA